MSFRGAIQRGKTAEVVAFGRNLGCGCRQDRRPASRTESVKTTISADAPAGVYRFLNHPTDHSVLPTGATFRFDGMQARPTFPTGESLTPVTMLVCDGPVVLESEPNAKESPQAVSLPAVVSGRFDQRGDADWFEFTASENGQVAIEVYAERIAAPADPYFVVVDEQGSRCKSSTTTGTASTPLMLISVIRSAASASRRTRNIACSCRTATSAAAHGFSTC